MGELYWSTSIVRLFYITSTSRGQCVISSSVLMESEFIYTSVFDKHCIYVCKSIQDVEMEMIKLFALF